MPTKTKADDITLDLVDREPVTHNAPALHAPPGGVVAAPPPTGPMAGALAFLNAGGSLDQLEKMMELQERHEKNEARKAYVEAMAEFKQNPPTIQKDKRVYFEAKDGKSATDYWHATLGNVTEAIVAGLAKVGVSHSWTPRREGDRIHVTCTLTHRLGHSESVTLDGPLDGSGNKNNIQQAGSTTTYLSRYTLLLITGLAVKDEVMPDTDGRGAHMDPFFGVDPELAQRARDASLNGWKALAAFTKNITEAERNSLIPASDALKKAAKAADEQKAPTK